MDNNFNQLFEAPYVINFSQTKTQFCIDCSECSFNFNRLVKLLVFDSNRLNSMGLSFDLDKSDNQKLFINKDSSDCTQNKLIAIVSHVIIKKLIYLLQSD